ncbi:hypothetical protein OG439_09920 [Amycolatopsis sp. NBC_01307]|uniref:hypothetical protein n=1 Tax=Amycolatopsis sp. NBC_01307 TaxID=2903561 RepID=UPI002E1056F1|nr:hypothetical protein OG439_09920 [Amycolatopsis sp. NBC_01307]
MATTTTETPHWTIGTAGDIATFTRVRPAPGGPRVWSGRGLALPEADLPTFGKALGEVMKLPVYWSARARAEDRSAGEQDVWSAPRHDPDDGFVHIAGPCHLPAEQPEAAFTLSLVHVRGLRVRIAAYLRDRDAVT